MRKQAATLIELLVVMKINGSWNAKDAARTRHDNMPAQAAADVLTTGGNEVICDGSVEWIMGQAMFCRTVWKKAGTSIGYFYEDPLDFNPTLKASLKFLACKS